MNPFAEAVWADFFQLPDSGDAGMSGFHDLIMHKVEVKVGNFDIANSGRNAVRNDTKFLFSLSQSSPIFKPFGQHVFVAPNFSGTLGTAEIFQEHRVGHCVDVYKRQSKS